MAFSLTIGGSALPTTAKLLREGSVAPGTRITDNLGSRATMDCSLISSDPDWLPDVGSVVVLSGSAGVIRTAYLWSAKQKLLRASDDDHSVVELSCVGMRYLADKRLVSHYWGDVDISENPIGVLASAVMGWLATNIFTAEGVTCPSGPGTTVGPISFQAAPVSDVLTWLATATGCVWWIDDGKTLHFEAAGSTSAGTLMVDDGLDALEGSIEISHSLSGYANRVHAVAQALVVNPIGKYIYEVLDPAPDGTRMTWTVTYPIADYGAVLWARAAPPYDHFVPEMFNYTPGERDISVAPYPLRVGSEPYLIYYTTTANTPELPGYEPVEATASDSGEISRMAALAGGSGIVELEVRLDSLTTQDGIDQIAAAILDRVSSPVVGVRLSTYNQSITPVPGKSITATIPGETITSWIVTSATRSDMGRPDDVMLWTLDLVSALEETWDEWVSAWLAGNKQRVSYATLAG